MNLISNPLFSNESLKKATRSLGWAIHVLCFDNNGLQEQLQAGKRLSQSYWILALIIDHVFDYYPVQYFTGKRYDEYLDFYNWFMSHKTVGLENALRYVENDYAVLETITRDELNQHRVPNRKLDEETHVINVFKELIKNSTELFDLLDAPKRVSDPEKPSANLVKGLILRISQIQKSMMKMADDRGDSNFSFEVFKFTKTLEIFKNPLLHAWEIYHYGHHHDFWEEGDSMMDYMMYEMKARNTINQLIDTLVEHSFFMSLPDGQVLTEQLLKVYRHMLKQKI